jgi:hypothetical protein
LGSCVFDRMFGKFHAWLICQALLYSVQKIRIGREEGEECIDPFDMTWTLL